MSIIALILVIILTLVSCGQSVMEIKHTATSPAGQTEIDIDITKAERTEWEGEAGLIDEPL